MKTTLLTIRSLPGLDAEEHMSTIKVSERIVEALEGSNRNAETSNARLYPPKVLFCQVVPPSVLSKMSENRVPAQSVPA